uniref:Protein kinase domain-containing protein n=1 Tax=Macrostomum lignano TaxID=282301 RepID=A0A1I8JR78_9PLAT
MVRNEKRFSRQAAKRSASWSLLNVRDGGCPQQCSGPHLETSAFRNHVCTCSSWRSMNLYELVRKKSLQDFSLAAFRENILLKCPGRSGVKSLFDFGSSCHEHQRVYTLHSVPLHRAPPSVILGGKLRCPIDMWSFGCILAVSCHGSYRAVPRPRTKATSWPAIMELCGTPPQALLDACRRTKVFFSSRGLPRYSSHRALRRIAVPRLPAPLPALAARGEDDPRAKLCATTGLSGACPAAWSQRDAAAAIGGATGLQLPERTARPARLAEFPIHHI